MATTQFILANNVNTQLAAATPASGSGSTTFTLASSANLPTLGTGQVMPLTLNDAATGSIYEVVYVTAISGVTLTVTRAQEGTTAQNWSIGDYAFSAPTAGTVATTLGNPNNTFSVAPATSSSQAPQLAQMNTAIAAVPTSGRLLSVQVMTSSGTYTRNPSAGTVIAEAVGAGAGTGGAPTTGSGGFSGSAGGSSGSYAKVLFTSAQIGASQTVTIGAGGTAGAAGTSTGGTGGTTSIGSLISCPGGIGSTSYGPTANTVYMVAPPAPASAPTISAGTVIDSTQGSNGQPAFGSTAGGVIGGTGGPSPMDGTLNGPGAGAQGTALGATAAAIAGLVGKVGKAIFWEYA